MISTGPVVSTKVAHDYFGHGKVLLSGEYFVLDGAMALALPTTVGQSMRVRYEQSYAPTLNWKSYDLNGKEWMEANFEYWHFNEIDGKNSDVTQFLQGLLRQARRQNPHFLREEMSTFVETRLGFPLEWGLGSSSTLIHNIAQWAYTSPFELLFKTVGGSGYDIACAQSQTPILYEKKSGGPNWSPISFHPPFSESLYFIYLGKKQDSRAAVKMFEKSCPYSPELINAISSITSDMARAHYLTEFDFLIRAHEEIVSKTIKMTRIKEERFADYWGEIKSLGAWGGDFILATSNRTAEETRDYFINKGHYVFIPYHELILKEEGHPFSLSRQPQRMGLH